MIPFPTRHPGLQTDKVEWRRVVAACLALFHLGSVSLLTHADALLDAADMGMREHVDSPDGDDCDVRHSHLLCQVVRSFSHAGVPLGATTENELAPPIRVAECDREGDDAERSSSLRGSVLPRGPPV